MSDAAAQASLDGSDAGPCVDLRHRALLVWGMIQSRGCEKCAAHNRHRTTGPRIYPGGHDSNRYSSAAALISVCRRAASTRSGRPISTRGRSGASAKAGAWPAILEPGTPISLSAPGTNITRGFCCNRDERGQSRSRSLCNVSIRSPMLRITGL